MGEVPMSKDMLAWLCSPFAEIMADGQRLTALCQHGRWAVRRITELEGQHKGLVMQNAMLRQRPDLPADRIPAAEAYEAEIRKLQQRITDLSECQSTIAMPGE